VIEERLLEKRDGRLERVDPDNLSVGIPEGLRDVIGRRLSGLSDVTHEVLAVAALLGIEFQLQALLHVAQKPEDEVIAALEEAARAAVVDERPGTMGRVSYRFTHALIRRTLYEELSAPRRMRWHHQVAQALEQLYQRHLDEHSADLAEHFLRSGSTDDVSRGMGYAEIAARRAMEVYACGDAVGLLEQALEAQRLLDPDDWVRQCDLLLALGEAVLPTQNIQKAAEKIGAQAFSLADAHGDGTRAARAAIQVLEAWLRSPRQFSEDASAAEWVARADRHASDGTVERVYADLYQGRWSIGTGRPSEGHAHFRRALERARRLGDDAVFAAAAGDGLTFLQAQADVELLERVGRELTQRRFSRARTGHLATGLASAGRVLLGSGDRKGAEIAWQHLAQLAEERRDPAADAAAEGTRAVLAILDGRLLAARQIMEDVENAAQAMYADTWYDFRGRHTHDLIRVGLYLGQPSDNLPPWRGNAGLSDATRILKLSALGRLDEARAECERFLSQKRPWEDRGLQVLVMLLEASIQCRDADLARTLGEQLAPLAGRVHGNYPVVSYGRLLGEAARMVGDVEQARNSYGQALNICELVRFRPEVALLHLDLAELLVEHYPAEHTDIGAHLGHATGDLRSMRMQPGLERAMRLAERIGQRTAGPKAGGGGVQVDGGLTAREHEVAGLVAAGQTNREIAEMLVISEGTAEVHVKHILNKLGFKSRAQIAAWVAERGRLAKL
jgi:DNA-binding CsgD family transcriptional regulator